MPRKPRTELAGGIHHVTSVGSRRLAFFVDDDDRRFFLRQLELAVLEHEWRCLSLCLLDNHYHLLVETPEPNLGLGMQAVLTAYVQNFHSRHGTDGALVHRRFYSDLVRTESHLICALRYIALNPVNAHIVARPADHRWSTCGELLAGRAGPLVAFDRVEELLEGIGHQPGARYRVILAPVGPWGSWQDATSPLAPRPPLAQLLAQHPLDEAMNLARWEYGYRLREIALATGRAVSTVHARTSPKKGV